MREEALSRHREFEDLMEALTDFSSSGIRPGLERVSRLLHLLGDPQASFPAIHVLGTNGKGSSSAGLVSILRAYGRKTALYTSPHLISMEERVLIDGEPLPVERWRDAFAKIKRAVETDAVLSADKPSFFETLTVLACLLIASASPDIAVVEAGMGGRYDATSVCSPIATLITPIGMDHMEYLGNTLEAIAAEKFAAVRPGVPAFFAGDDAALSAQFRARCEEAQAPSYLLDTLASAKDIELAISGTSFTYQPAGADAHNTLRDLHTPLIGVHQAQNAARVVTLLRVLKERYPAFGGLEDRHIREGLGQTRWPGRMEAVTLGGDAPLLLLDGAHNMHGMAALMASLRALEQGRDAVSVGAILFAAMRDKDIATELRSLKELGAPLYCAELPMARAMPAADLARLASGFGIEVRGASSAPREALSAALRETPSERVLLCCGSLYFVGAVKALLQEEDLCGGARTGRVILLPN